MLAVEEKVKSAKRHPKHHKKSKNEDLFLSDGNTVPNTTVTITTQDLDKLKRLGIACVKEESRISRSSESRRSPLLGSRNSKRLSQKDLSSPQVTKVDKPQPKSMSKDARARSKFSHKMYDKAAVIFEHLSNGKLQLTVDNLLKFGNEFEKRRAYSLAIAAKRYETVLKDVLLDSYFYSSYFSLETFHHSKVMVMLLEFYERNFTFSDTVRCKISVNSEDFLDYINEIQQAFLNHKIKLCSAFARNRIKQCALTLEALLPLEVRESGECGAKHPLHVRINFNLTNKEVVLKKLTDDGFVLNQNFTEEEENVNKSYHVDDHFTDLLVFSTNTKDDVYNHDLTLDSCLIPQSKPRYLLAQIVKNISTKHSLNGRSSMQLLPAETHEVCNVLLTHAETGSLSAHLCSSIGQNQKLVICGCTKRKREDVEMILKQMGVLNYELIPDRFIDISPSDERIKLCRIIICNPLCSKSGVVNPVDFILHEGSDAAIPISDVSSSTNLRSFVQQQVIVLQHALSFSFAKSVLYCTFSLHSEENQDLVGRVLQSQFSEGSKNESWFDMANIPEDIVASVCPTNDTKYLSMPPSSHMDGFFISLLNRKWKEDTVREILDRANKHGLVIKAGSHTKTTKKKKQKQSNMVKSKSPNSSPNCQKVVLAAKEEQERKEKKKLKTFHF